MKQDMEKGNTVKIVVSLLLLSLALQCYSLSRYFRSITLLSSDLFEMFRPLGYLYFLSGILLVTAISIYYIAIDKISKANVVLSLYIASLVMYKLLPKYVYYLPLQREIYHTASIIYVYNYHNIEIPGYPSNHDSVGYAIFYAVLGWILGFNKQAFISFLAVFTDLFHLLIITLVSLTIIRRNVELSKKFSLLILSIPIIFTLQVNTTYRNGFGALLMAYIVAVLCIDRIESLQNNLLLLIPFLLAAAVSYPGIIPLFTIGMLLYLLLVHILKSLIIKKQSISVSWAFHSIIIANVLWIFWQSSRYPKLYIVIRMYVNNLLKLIANPVRVEGVATKYITFAHHYHTLLTLRIAYALTLIVLIGIPAISVFHAALKRYKWKSIVLIAASFTIVFESFILVGAKGGFHFAAIYNIFSSISAILFVTLVPFTTRITFLNKGIAKKRNWIKGSLWIIIIFVYSIFTIVSPVALWPAFKNLMPLEAKEIYLFKTLSNFAIDNARVGYLGLYGGTMGTAIQYIFADRTDIRLLGIPYPIHYAPSYKLIAVANNIISSESKVSFYEPLTLWLDSYLEKLYTEDSFNKVVDFGNHYEVLCR